VHRKATISVVEMRRLCWVCGKVRYDRIRDDNIRERFGVGHIVEKMVEKRRRCFGHVERGLVHFLVRRVDLMKGSQITRD
jgi:hypothetical protein